MRLGCASLSVFSLLVFGQCMFAVTAVAETFPYKAYIRGNDVYVRSGPGKNYYPIEKLARGVEIEVYRHDPGGWYAIRPPEGSFSWITGRQLRPLEDNLAEVIGDEVVAYVGSKFSDVHDVHQVKLERGELVEVIGEKRFVSPNDGLAETWYKIAPPRGEFRWVFGRFVVRQGIAATTATKGKSKSSGTAAEDRWQNSASARDAELAAADADNKYLIPADRTGVAPSPIVVAPDPGGRSIRIAPESLDASHSGIRLASLDEAAETTRSYSHRTATRARRASLGPMTPLDELNHDLSLMLADPPATWRFQDVRSRAQTELNGAQSALDRGKARALLRELDRYEQLQEDFVEADGLRETTDRENRLAEIAATPPTVRHASAEGTDDQSQFDGVGRLAPVVSKRIGAPRFALTNSEGEVLMFVTPAAGIDMQPLVGKVVGLTGTRGYMPELRKPHLTAVRVEQLEASALLAVKPLQY